MKQGEDGAAGEDDAGPVEAVERAADEPLPGERELGQAPERLGAGPMDVLGGYVEDTMRRTLRRGWNAIVTPANVVQRKGRR